MNIRDYAMVSVVCSLVLVCAKTNAAESKDPPSWRLGGGVSFFQFDPNLPRDITIHQTHPDDQAFLSGSAGETKLDKVDITFLNLSVEHTWGIAPDWNWGVSYVLKIPLAKSGREEKQNENDFRPSTEGSFIYTQINAIDPAHEIGLNLSYQWFTESEINYEIRPSILFGYWQMEFEKGWDRFGRDETALSSRAKGLSLSPQLSITAGTPNFKVGLSAGYRFMNLEYDTDVLGSSVAQGWEVGGTITVRL